MARFKQSDWSDYDVGIATEASSADLRDAVRRAANTANKRLKRLENAGATKGVYRMVESNIGRNRFRGDVSRMSQSELRHEYTVLREFLSAKSSTISGRKSINKKRFEKAVRNGFDGTEAEFYDEVERLFTEAVENYYSSDVIYNAIITGSTDIVDEVIERLKNKKGNPDRKKALKAYLDEYHAKQKGKSTKKRSRKK